MTWGVMRHTLWFVFCEEMREFLASLGMTQWLAIGVAEAETLAGGLLFFGQPSLELCGREYAEVSAHAVVTEAA